MQLGHKRSNPWLSIFRFIQSRVTSVRSWYLTSLVNLSFCGFDHSFRFRNPFSATISCLLCFLISEQLFLRWNIPHDRRWSFETVCYKTDLFSIQFRQMMCRYLGSSLCIYKIAYDQKKYNMESCINVQWRYGTSGRNWWRYIKIYWRKGSDFGMINSLGFWLMTICKYNGRFKKEAWICRCYHRWYRLVFFKYWTNIMVQSVWIKSKPLSANQPQPRSMDSVRAVSSEWPADNCSL